jgi:hypothetical protein
LANVLLGWEIGEGMSYVRALIKVGRKLAERGHRLFLSVPNLVEPWPAIPEDIPTLQAPVWHPRRWRGDKPFLAATFADVLAIRGYAAVDDLMPMVQAWQRMLDLIQPKLLLVAYCPTLVLAASRKYPTVEVAPGWFGAPPVHEQWFPTLVPGQAPVVPQEHLLGVIQEVQRRRQQEPPTSLPSFMAPDHRFLLIYPELDPYRTHRPDAHSALLDDEPKPVPFTTTPTFFSYLTAEYPRMEEILQTLSRAGCKGTVYLRNATPSTRDQLRSFGLQVLDQPASREEMLAPSVLLHHGGVGTSQLALAAGKPQLLFPMHLEQRINSETLNKLGVGHYFAGNVPLNHVIQGMKEVLDLPKFREKATALSQQIFTRPRTDTLGAIVERCLQYL